MSGGAAPPTLTARGVHVWSVSLAGAVAQRDFGDLLSPEERERADRLKFERDRRRFISFRGILRTILGRYLDVSPAVIEFCYGSSGKPSLGPCGSRHPLRFNLSHSEDTALYAVALGREVGVDIERIRTDVQTAELAGQFFSASERRALSSLAVADRTEAFFRCWTLKEAFIKAHGEGLSLPLEQFDVAFARGAPVAVIAIHGDTEDAARWSLREIPVEPRYVAAIAAAGNDWDLWCGEWSA